MFAMKSMDKLLQIKLDMVYRNLPKEEAQKRFMELNPEAPKAPEKKVIRRVRRVKQTLGKDNE